MPWPGDIIIKSEFSDMPLGRRRRSMLRGDSSINRELSALPGAEMGEPRCDDCSSSSSSDCFSHPFCTLTMAYESRVFSCAESWQAR